VPASAQDATWLANPGSGNFNAGANWSGGAVPTGTATFGATNTPTIAMSGNWTVGGMTFSAGAPAYAFTLLGTTFVLDGVGIVNNSSNRPTFDAAGALFELDNSATAGNAIINNSGGAVTFTGTSTGGSAQMTTDGSGLTSFTDDSTAGNAIITTNNNGKTQFSTNANAGNAQLITNGSGIVDFSGTAGAANDNRVTAGSIEGSGTYNLGGNQLAVGGNNLSTSVSGTINDGGGSGGAGASLVKTGTGTLTLSGTNTYTGATTVNAGTLAVDGSIATSSRLTVNSGGTLGGTGYVPTTTINGGTLSPGNSIGTITVQGNLGFTSASFYRVEVLGSGADKTNVIGTAALAGTVQVIVLPGALVPMPFTILHAERGRTGTFGGVVDSANFTSSLAYTGTDVKLTLTAALGNGGGLSIKQQNVAASINNYFNGGGILPVGFSDLFRFTGDNLGTALSQLSGEGATGAATASFQSMNGFLTRMLNPFGGAPNGNMAAAGTARSFAAVDKVVSPAAAAAYAAVTPKDQAGTLDQRWGLWGTSYGRVSKTGGSPVTIGSHDITARDYGLTAGAEYRVNGATVVGFALDGGSTSWGLSNGLGGGRSDLFQLGLHGSHNFGAAYVSAVLGFAWHKMSTSRTVFVAGDDRFTASFNARNIGARIETGYRFDTLYLGITPYAALQAQNFRTPRFSENVASGAGTFALSVADKTVTTTRAEFGAWLDRLVELDGGRALTMRARAAWAHDAVTDPSLTATFQALPGVSFVVNGARPAPNAALLSAGAELRLASNITLDLKLDGEFSPRSQSYAANGELRKSW